MVKKELVQVLAAAISVLLAVIFSSSLHISVSCDDSSELNEAERAELAKLMTFDEFLKHNPRDYVNNAAELERRRKIFEDNSIFIAKHNAGPEGKLYRLRPTDKAFDEFKPGRGKRAISPEYEIVDEDDEPIDDGGGIVMAPAFKKKNKIVSLFRSKRPVIPDGPEGSPTHIDADLRYCALNFDVQGTKCGCCFAFSYNAFAEWHYCRQTNGENINFSEQYYLDCGHMYGLAGCNGGKISVAKAMSRFVGFKLEKDLPYIGKRQTCNMNRNSENLKVEVYNWVRLEVNRTHWEELLKEQPIVTHVKLPPDYTVYDQGIHHGEDCSDGYMSHGMVLMGYGSEEGEPYWILKNSQGLDWGESGYFRLSRTPAMEKCFEDGYVSKFRFSNLPREAADDFYDSLNVVPIKKVVPEKEAKDGKPGEKKSVGEKSEEGKSEEEKSE